MKYASDVTSQCGEDGIIAKALTILPDRARWCVEFGAWDGKFASNTYSLVASHNYQRVFIEGDPKRFRDLERTHAASGRNVLLNAMVGFSKSDSLDVILSRCEIPNSFDILSIDIDGNDYHVWEAVEQYRPKLVVIEYNPTISNSVIFVQKKDPALRQGASPASLVVLGQRKGYELVAVTYLNLIFAASEYYPAFGIPDNALELMRDDSNTPHIFIGYDGHIFLAHGKSKDAISLPWHKLKLREGDVQVLPERLQKYPDDYSPSDKRAFLWKFGLKRPWRD